MRLHSTLAAVLLLFAACGAPQPEPGQPAPQPAPGQPAPGQPAPRAPGEPAPLAGAAAERMRAQIATFDGPGGPSQLHGSPGTVTLASGEQLPYDRYCLVGSQLAADRGRSFETFVEALRAEGGEFQTIESRAEGKPSKILVVLDGKRIVVSVQQW